MGKNKKEQAAYDYLHDNKPVRGKLLYSILNKFWRHDCDIGEYRKLRKDKLDKESGNVDSEG